MQFESGLFEFFVVFFFFLKNDDASGINFVISLQFQGRWPNLKQFFLQNRPAYSFNNTKTSSIVQLRMQLHSKFVEKNFFFFF